MRLLGAPWAGPTLVALACYAATVASLVLARSLHGGPEAWPASGVLLAALLLAPRPVWIRYVAAAVLANLAAELGAHPPLVAVGFTAGKMAGAALAAWLLRRRDGRRPSFVHLDGLGRFCRAAIVGNLVGTTILALVTPASSPTMMALWFTADLLGLLVIAPMILIAAELRGSLGWAANARRLLEAAALLGGLAAVTVGTFAQSGYPLLFLPVAALLVAVVRLGPFAAAAGVAIIAGVGALATARGTGPVLLIQDGQAARVLFLQFYVLVAFASALPIAALLATRDRLTASLAERNRLLTMAEGVAQFGHWRLDAATRTAFWSDEVFRIFGYGAGVAPSLANALAAYHPDDRPRVASTIQAALDGGAAFEYAARIVRPNGEVRHVFVRGDVDQGHGGEVMALFGVTRDVSRQVTHEQGLERAKERAEEVARHATTMAVTDHLTGLANRRKTLHVLDKAVATARRAGDVVSVVAFDVDHFKRVNDTLGHAAGDAVLRRLARDASAVLRAGDLVGRIGGEEFLLVLPGTDQRVAATIAERVRLSIRAGGGSLVTDPPVSASFGVATLSGDETAEALLGRADRALYEAKVAGRNTLRQAA